MIKQVSSLFPYFKYVEGANTFLDGVREFCFYPGMLFGSREKWWPDTGTRPTSHEGVDICYYVDSKGKEQKISAETKIPAIAQGRVFTFCRDFLGQSIFLDHGVDGSLRFLSVYAHIMPLHHLVVGQEIQKAEVVGKVADTTGRKNRMPAHVHISLLKVPQAVSADILDWKFICNSEQVVLIDPLTKINCRGVTFRQGKPLHDQELEK